MNIRIETERLVLRRFDPADHEPLKALLADKEGSEFSAYDQFFPFDDDSVRRALEYFAATGDFLAVELAAEKALIGYIAIPGGETRNLGFCFHSTYRRRGYAFEACSAVIERLFAECGTDKFETGTAKANAQAVRLLEKLGFAKTAEEESSFRNDEDGNPIVFIGCLYELKNGTSGIALKRAALADAEEIHRMQVEAFNPLLDRYHDFELSPAAEPVERVQERLRQPFTHFYIVVLGGRPIGAVRIVLVDDGERCRISPIFILPGYQNRGYAQRVFKEIEKLYSPRQGWELDTILEEAGNCHLYEKMGYTRTGKAELIHEGMHIVRYEKPGKSG